MIEPPAAASIDPLGYRAALTERAEYPLLGKRLQIRSNSPAVLLAAAESFYHWLRLEPDCIEQARPLIVEVVVHRAERPEASLQPPVCRLHGDTLLGAAGSNLISAQLDRGRGLAFVTPAAAANSLYLRYYVLEALALSLATWHGQDRVPLHAGAVVRNGRAIVLVGPQGAGKSTLCYAAWRAGFRLLAEDGVYISRSQGLRVWGNPGSVHLLPDAQTFFPELAGLPLRIQPNGEWKVNVSTNRPTGELALYADHAVLCLLQRHLGDATQFFPCDLGSISREISEDSAGGGLFATELPRVLAELTAEGAYVLRVGRDLTEAVAALGRLAEKVA